MPTTTAAVRRRVGWLSIVATAVALGTYVVLYLAYAAYLVVFADEGALPPRWRIPEIPSEVQVVRETEACGSGGCSRVLVVRPEQGQTAEDLADELDLIPGRRHGWQWYDPHSVWMGASVTDEGDLAITVGY